MIEGFEKTDDEKQREKVADIILELVRKYDNHPFEINKGFCEEFADALAERLGTQADGVMVLAFDDLEEDPVAAHFFVFYAGRYYDAEEPYGVKNYRHLPIYQRAQRNWD